MVTIFSETEIYSEFNYFIILGYSIEIIVL
jgi:hypothetical protein